MGKKVLVGIGICFSCLLVLFFFLFAFLNTEAVHRHIQKKINQTIPGNIMWEKGRFSLLGTTVMLEGIVVTGAATERLATIKRFSADVSFLQLLLGDLAFKKVVVEHPSAWLHVDDQGQVNIIDAFVPDINDDVEASEEGLPLNIAIKSLQLTDGFLLFERKDKGAEKGKERITLRHVAVTVEDANLKTQTARLSVNIEKGDLSTASGNISLQGIDVNGALNGQGIDALTFALSTETSSLNGHGDVKDLFATPIIDLTLASHINLGEIQNLFPQFADLTGPLTLDLILKGPLDNPDVKLKGEYGEGTIAGSPVDALAFQCRLEDRHFRIEDMMIRSPLAVVTATGDANLQKAFPQGFLASKPDFDLITYTLTLTQKGGALQNVLETGSKIAGHVQSQVMVKGHGIDPHKLSAEATLDLSAEDVVLIPNLPPAKVQANGKIVLKAGRVTVESFEAQSGQTTVAMEGTYDVPSKKLGLTAQLASPDLSVGFVPPAGKHVRGALYANAFVKGSLDQPEAELSLDGQGLAFQDVILGDMTAHVGLEKGIISLDRVQLTNADSALNLEGTIQTLDPDSGAFLQNPELNVTVKGDAIHLKDFIESATGTLSVQGHIRGPTREPQGKLVLKGHTLQVGEQKIDTVLLTSRFDGGRFHVDSLVIKPVKEEQMQVTGWISRDMEYAMEMTARHIDLSHIYGFQEVLPLKGALSLDLKGEGTLQNPQLTGTAAVRNLSLDDKILKDLACDITLKDQKAMLSFDSDFDLEGTIHIDSKDFTLDARFEQTELTPYLRLAQLKEIHGVLTGKATLEGNVTAPNTIQGEIGFSQLDLFADKKPLVRARDFQASFQNQELMIPRVRVDLGETGHLTIEGKGRVDGPLDLKANGSIPMQIIQAFTHNISEATGDMALSAAVQGDSRKPQINVVGDLNNLGFFVPTMAQRVQNIQGKIRATTNHIVLENCHGNLDTGRFSVSGNIDLEELQPSKVLLNAQVENLPIQLPNTLDIMVEGKLHVQGTREASTARGKVVVIDGTYYKDVELNLIGGDSLRRRRTVSVQEEMKDPFLKNMAFDVAVTHRKPFLIDNNLALLTVKPDLRLYGKMNNLLLSGRAEVESGIITYQKEDFNVTQGVFDFINPYRIEPTIDVKGEMKIRRWTIFLEVTGVPDNLKFILTSNPSETTEDIVSLLAFRKTTAELIGDESGSPFSTTEMLSDILGGALGEEIKDATGLDEVRIGYVEGDNDDEEGGVDVSLGKKLSRRATVKYGVESRGAQTIQRVDVGYKLRQNLSVNSFRNTEGQFGGELLYRLEFR